MKLEKIFSLTNLREEVMTMWDNEGVEYFRLEFVSDDPPRVENWLKDWAEKILDNPRLMLLELGYDDNDWATYVAERTV